LDDAMSDQPGEVLAAAFREVHRALRTSLEGRDEGVLNQMPGPGMNSVATIVVHLLGSEAETLNAVAGVVHDRDRAAEFSGGTMDAAALFARLADAEALLDRIEPTLTGARLTADVALPTMPADDRRPGLRWLVSNYGHAREHLAQLELTLQLLDVAK